jgi:SpoIID/LytB domain protein
MRAHPHRTPRVLALLVGAAMVAPGPATGPAGAAASPDAWRVPAHATVGVRGHGFGHGHGMSQYGAEGAARQGLTYRQIADFYYPGTSWGTARGRVDVLITADTTDDLVVEARPGLTVRDTHGGDPVVLPDNGARRWRVAVAPNGATRVAYLLKRWHGFAELDGDGELYAGGAPITLVTPAGEVAYRGRLRAASTDGGHDTVNDVTLENYVQGVVPLEMPATWSPAAVRAQAVAARTYAAYERDHALADDYQICDTTSCQVYGGYDAEHPASNAAVDATRGRVLLADGAPAFTQFASSSGGWTAAGSVPYLPAREDPYDDWSGNPVHSWSVELTDTTLEHAFPAVGDLRRIAVVGRDGHGDWGGRLVSLRLSGSDGSVTVSGDGFRSALGLRSTWVTFQVS